MCVGSSKSQRGISLRKLLTSGYKKKIHLSCDNSSFWANVSVASVTSNVKFVFKFPECHSKWCGDVLCVQGGTVLGFRPEDDPITCIISSPCLAHLNELAQAID